MQHVLIAGSITPMENEYRLLPKQIITRIIAVLVGGLCGSACGYSLLLQVQEIGTIIASICWFSGMAGVVFALAGYAVSCDPGKGKSYISVAVICGCIFIVIGTALARIYLDVYQVIFAALAISAFMGVVLIFYHFALKREDPDAI